MYTISTFNKLIVQKIKINNVFSKTSEKYAQQTQNSLTIRIFSFSNYTHTFILPMCLVLTHRSHNFEYKTLRCAAATILKLTSVGFERHLYKGGFSIERLWRSLQINRENVWKKISISKENGHLIKVNLFQILEIKEKILMKENKISCVIKVPYRDRCILFRFK